MIKKSVVRACCGSTSYLLELDQPITTELHEFCKSKGYLTSPMYEKVGVFFITRNQLTASGPYGGNKLQVKVAKQFAEPAMNELVANLETFFQSKAQ